MLALKLAPSPPPHKGKASTCHAENRTLRDGKEVAIVIVLSDVGLQGSNESERVLTADKTARASCFFRNFISCNSHAGKCLHWFRIYVFPLMKLRDLFISKKEL